MVEKRGAPDAADGVNGSAEEPAKKPRLDQDGAAAPAAGAPAKPSLSLAALEKAKKALQLQKELKEKLKKLPQLQQGATGAAASAGATPAAAAAPASTLPPPPAAAASADAQQSALQAAAAAAAAAGGLTSLLPPPPTQAPAQPAAESFYDPRMSNASLRKLARRPRPDFEFVEEGEFQRQAEAFRLKARYGRDAVAPPPVPRGPIGPAAAGDPNQVPLGAAPTGGTGQGTPGLGQEEEDEGEDAVEEVPDVEWWDRPLLASGSYEADVPPDLQQPVAIKENKITLYVEHPIPIEPPAEAPPPPPQPLKLTQRELKKMRTQRRQAREKEKQDLIRQGLLEPPKPKVKLSNLYRVLGEQAVLDPTAIEMETRRQMAERRAAHEDRNLANSLTPAERREKKLRKMFDDNGLDLLCSVYKVGRLDSKLNRIKVDINAKENHMTGVLLITPDFTLVVVEGCRKAAKRYAKLMLRRIDWDLPPSTDKDGAALGDDAGDEPEEDEGRPPNSCHLVWQGVIKEAAFKGFKAEECRTIEHAQQVLAQANVGHYWDAARSFVPGESVAVELD